MLAGAGPVAGRPGPAAVLAAVSIAVGLAVSLLTAGCSALAAFPGASRSELNRDLVAAGFDPRGVIVPYELSVEARSWLEATRLRRRSADRRLHDLLDLMTSEDGLAITYDRSFTGTASEVFERRKANCLGFMNLFVGFGRELEIPVYFLSVEDDETFQKHGDLVLISDHIAAGFGPLDDMQILDFATGERPKAATIRAIPDITAVAKYYSNRGAEHLRDAANSAALPWLETATRLDPSLASVWVNLGVGLRRQGDLAGADEAYRKALEIDPRTPSAYQNLAALLRLQGREQEAIGLLARVASFGSRNPYNYLSLGDWSLEAGRLEEARRFYRRALALHGKDPEPYAAMGQLELASGNRAKARRWLKRAERFEGTSARLLELRDELRNDGTQASGAGLGR